MDIRNSAWRCCLLVLAAGCGSLPPAQIQPEQEKPKPTQTSVQVSAMYEGGFLISTADGTASVAISATIVPRTFAEPGGLYAHQGASYPATPAEALQVALDAAMTFPFLLQDCASRHPEITLQPADGSPLTEQQLATNREAVFECGYQDYGIKPYWIPQLIDDVDLCGAVLPGGWHLPTSAELGALSTAALAAYAAATPSDPFGNAPIFVRGSDGTLGLGSLSAVAGAPLPARWGDPRDHFEGGAVLRCIRTGAQLP